MYKRYSLEIRESGEIISGTYVRPKSYQVLDHMLNPASISLYPIAPDYHAALMIYAPPASGKSTFMMNLHNRFCSCEIRSFSRDVQFVDHEYHIIDTDHCIFNRSNIVITNVYNLICRAEKVVAILPSEVKMASRYSLRNLQLDYKEYETIRKVCENADVFIQSDDYVDNLLKFTEL